MLQKRADTSEDNLWTTAQRQTAVTAYFSSKQLLLFAFAWQNNQITTVQIQKAVSAYITSKQILPSGFADQIR